MVTLTADTLYSCALLVLSFKHFFKYTLWHAMAYPSNGFSRIFLQSGSCVKYGESANSRLKDTNCAHIKIVLAKDFKIK